MTKVGRIAEVVFEILDVQRPGNVDRESIMVTGERSEVEIVLIPHRQLGGFSLGVWADPGGIDVFWAGVDDLSTHDAIDLGLKVDRVPWNEGWQRQLQDLLTKELARPITLTVKRRPLRRQLECMISVKGRKKTMTIGKAPDARERPDEATTLMGSEPLTAGAPVPLENWRRWA
jgi:hypothetical protein